MNTYTTQAGDTADAIAFKYYGSLAGQVMEQLLDANPGLADQGPLLPEGVTVVLPAIKPSTTSTKAQGIKLWD
jgi:phage tail protein X